MIVKLKGRASGKWLIADHREYLRDGKTISSWLYGITRVSWSECYMHEAQNKRV